MKIILTVICGLFFIKFGKASCGPSNISEIPGKIYYYHYYSTEHPSSREECEWRFSYNEQEDFMLILYIDYLYLCNNAFLQLPSGRKYTSNNDSHGEGMCVAYTSQKLSSLKRECFSELAKSLCPQSQVPVYLQQWPPELCSSAYRECMEYGSSRHTNFRIYYVSVTCPSNYSDMRVQEFARNYPNPVQKQSKASTTAAIVLGALLTLTVFIVAFHCLWTRRSRQQQKVECKTGRELFSNGEPEVTYSVIHKPDSIFNNAQAPSIVREEREEVDNALYRAYENTTQIRISSTVR